MQKQGEFFKAQRPGKNTEITEYGKSNKKAKIVSQVT